VLWRLQFGITAVYHFLFVPLVIGLGFGVAGFETAWLRTGDDRWLCLARLFGKIFVIAFAMSMLTGIVQDIQLDVTWSAYARFSASIFETPTLAEGVVASVIEVIALGLWLFGWDTLPRWAHAACMWVLALGATVTAYVILAQNSWMQHPVGYRYHAGAHRVELTSFWDVLTNPTQLGTFSHTIAGCFAVAGGLVASIGMWHLISRPADAGHRDASHREKRTSAFRMAVQAGAITTLTAVVAGMITGDVQGKLMTEYQPMMMAAAEALYHTAKPAPFSLLTIGTLDGSKAVFEVTLPRLLSFLATGDFSARVQGIDNLQALYWREYGPGSYAPVIPAAYWSFRLMIGTGILAALIALVALWDVRRGRVPVPLATSPRPFLTLALALPVIALPLLPMAASIMGWIFTETARQPWLVFGMLKTSAGLSPGAAGRGYAWPIALTLACTAVAAIACWLIWTQAKAGLGTPEGPGDGTGRRRPEPPQA
jgi:cytochrome bd ubiquinol oxidase subunit I